MPAQHALPLADLPANTKKTVTLGDLKVLIVRTDDVQGQPTLFALEAECPHAGAPLERGAVCNGRLVCPWHTGTFELATGTLLEPPPLRDLKRYPVSLQGDAILVDPAPIAAQRPAPRGQGKHLVIAGAGAATAAALTLLRDRSFAGTITLIEPLAEEPVDRTQLTKNALAGKKPLDTLPLLSPPAKGGQELNDLKLQRVQATATKLNRADRTVTVSTGESIGYDALLLATGSQPKQLDVPGAELPHVFTIRHIQDLRRMEPLLTPGIRVALVGDSFIAFEAASALRQRGQAVTILANSKLPFEKKFGAAVAGGLVALHRSRGVTLHTEVEVTGITATGVTLSTGAEIPADLVIIAIGVEPITGYAPDLPAGKKGGFAVSNDLKLAPNLWCAGDIASVEGTRIEHWRLAEQHGRTAAKAILGYLTDDARAASTPFTGVPFFWTFHYDKRLSYAGHADTWDSLETEGDPLSLEFLNYYIKEGEVAAVLACKHDTAIAALMEPLRNPLTLAEAKAITANADQA